jgi:prepilin-type processing-associated H-X9-DG protein
MESRYAGDAVPYFEKIHRYLPGPQFYKLLVCPVDKTRQIATNPDTLNHSNLSYFFNADSQTTNQPAQALLAGDRNLTANGQGIEPGLFITTFKTDINWSSELHPYGGNLAFADGHVESVKKNEINAVFGRQPSATNHLVVP